MEGLPADICLPFNVALHSSYYCREFTNSVRAENFETPTHGPRRYIGKAMYGAALIFIYLYF